MSHLIQPIKIYTNDVDFEMKCNSCQGGKATPGIVTDILTDGDTRTSVIDNDCSPWTVLTGTVVDDPRYEPVGEISFGVSCGTKVDIDLVSAFDPPFEYFDYSIEVKIFVDGVQFGFTDYMSDGNDTASTAVTVTGGPCGSVVTIYAKSTIYDDPFWALVTLTATVIAITTP